MDYHSSHNYYSHNYNRLFNNKEFITKLLYGVKKVLGRHLNRNEANLIVNKLKSLDPVIFKNKTEQNILNALVDSLSKELKQYKCDEDDDIDIREMLKKEINESDQNDNYGIEFTSINTNISNTAERVISEFANKVEVTSLLGNRTLTDIQRLVNPDLVRSYKYIILDTRYRQLDNDGTTFFKWTITNAETLSQGSVNLTGNIRDITALRFFPIKLPYNQYADTFYDRITLSIDELSAQSFIAQENRRFQAIFDKSVDGKWIDLRPADYNDGYFRFDNPITTLQSLTVSFGNPLENIIFDADRLLANITNYGAVTEFTTTDTHNLQTGDLIYISNFTTKNLDTDFNIISLINTERGHSSIVVTGADTFEVDVDSSSIRTIGTGTVSVTNGSTTVTGSGTSFGTFFNVGDGIEISGSVYTIATISSQTLLTLEENYTNITNVGLTFYRNNILSGLRPNIYFGSKRIFIPIELEYFKGSDSS